MKINEAFGMILRKARRARSLSQSELALKTDLDRTFISLLERGERQPSLTTLFQIAKVLKTPPSDLVRQVERAHKKGNRSSGSRLPSSRV
jgi:transcriptional regulator with XRE-family HTH domain